MASGSDRPAQLGVQAFDGVRGVNNPANVIWKSEERDHLRPISLPGLSDGGIFLSPWAISKVIELCQSGFGILGLVNLLERRRYRFTVLVGDEGKRMADQMDDACLHLGLRKNCRNRVRETLEAVDDGDQHVLDAPGLEVIHDPQPELGALALLDPQPEDLLSTIWPDAKGDVHRLVAHGSFVTHLDPDCIKENQRVKRLQRPVLPFAHLLEDGVGDRADQIRRNVDPIELAQMPLDLARRHPAGVHRNDLFIKTRKPALVLGDQLRIKRRQPIAGNVQRELARSRQYRLLAIPIAAVAIIFATLKMMIHLRVQRPLGQSLLQLVQQPVLVKRRLRVRSSQKLIQKCIGNSRLFASCHTMSPFLASLWPQHEIPDTLTLRATLGVKGHRPRVGTWGTTRARSTA